MMGNWNALTDRLYTAQRVVSCSPVGNYKNGDRGKRERGSTHVHNGVAQVPLLAEQDVGRPGNEAPHCHVGQEVMLLQRHVGQAQVTLATKTEGGGGIETLSTVGKLSIPLGYGGVEKR